MNPPPPTLAASSGVSISKLPVSLFASVMGLSGLGLAWRLAHGLLGAPALVGEAVGGLAAAVFVLLVIGYLAKAVRHPGAVKAEFVHPVSGNFFGTVVISLLLLSSVVAPYSAPLSHGLWTVGAIAAFALSFVVVSRLLDGRVDALHVVPAWLIAGVATLDVAVTGGAMAMPWAAEMNLAAGAVGAVVALVFFVMIVTRLVHREPLPPAMTPSLVILVAPFAVGFLAYVNIAGGIDRFAALLFWFGLFVCAVVAPKVLRPRVPFTPAWWATSFPLAALVNAALRYQAFAASAPLRVLAIGMLGALSLLLAVLAVRTLRIVLNGELLRA